MKRIISGALLLALSGACLVRGQDLAPPRLYEGVAQAEEATPPPAGPSAWVRYTHQRCECCGPLGGDGPIATELYFRTGPSVPAAGGRIHDALNTGWLWAAGGRSIFYDTDQITAWTIDLGISDIYNNAGQSDVQFAVPAVIEAPPFPPFFFSQPVSVRTLNRTYANLGVGREYYLVGSAFEGNAWRLGWDVGGRLGAARLELNEVGLQNGYERLGSFAYGIFGALHTDVEFIRGGCCAWSAGFRFEFDQTWTEFRHIHSNEIWNANFLGTIGVRY